MASTQKKQKKNSAAAGAWVPPSTENQVRMTLSALTSAVTRIGEETGGFSIAEFCKANGIGKRRLYDATDVMVVLRLMEHVRSVDQGRTTKSFRWLGLEGMRQACASLYAAKPKTLLKQLFDQRHAQKGETKHESHLTRTARFMACFYMHGFYEAQYTKKNGQIIKAIKQYIRDTQMEARLGFNGTREAMIRIDKNIFRRVYDVSNVFECAGFYKCADAVLSELHNGQFTLSEPETPVKMPAPPGFVYSIPSRFPQPFPIEDGTGSDSSSSIRSSSDEMDSLMDALYASYADCFVYASLDSAAAASQNINDELLAGIDDTMPFAF